MSVFASYAKVYDALYGDKDYTQEITRIAELLRAGAPNARRLLELGCGTGLHAAALARLGYEITGIDLSHAMLDRAEDPEKLIRLMIREMEDTLVELKSACAGVMAETKKVQRQRDTGRELYAQHPDAVVGIEEQRMRLDAWVQQALEEPAQVRVDGEQLVLVGKRVGQ